MVVFEGLMPVCDIIQKTFRFWYLHGCFNTFFVRPHLQLVY